MTEKEEVKALLDDLIDTANLAGEWDMRVHYFYGSEMARAAREAGEQRDYYYERAAGIAEKILNHIKED